MFYLQATPKSFEQSQARHVAPPWRQPGNFLGCHGRWVLKSLQRVWRRFGSHLFVETYARPTSGEPMRDAGASLYGWQRHSSGGVQPLLFARWVTSLQLPGCVGRCTACSRDGAGACCGRICSILSWSKPC